MYDAGVIGRFDGATIAHKLTDQIEFGLVGGFLLDSSFDSPNTDRPFYGLYGEYASASGAFSFKPFLLQQTLDGEVDRRAIGFQSHWTSQTTLILGMMDYDVYHAALNNVLLIANFGIGKDSSFNFSFDRRRSPYITTRNALIGQPFEELSDLEQELVDLSLKDLASDRTATTTSVRAGWNRRLSSRWEFTTDVLASELSSTDSSQNVVGFDARQDMYYSMQLARPQPVRRRHLFGVAIALRRRRRHLNHHRLLEQSLQLWQQLLVVSQGAPGLPQVFCLGSNPGFGAALDATGLSAQQSLSTRV